MVKLPAHAQTDPGRKWLRLGLAVIALAALAGCVGVKTEPVATGPVFYPPLPNPPRIQHLTTYSSDRDLHPVEKGGFADFVLGEDQGGQRLRQPYGMAMYEGKLYVADSRAPGLAIFDLVKREFSLVTGSGNGRMRRPINVTIDSDGTKYVADTGQNQVLVYGRDDKFIKALGIQDQFKPVDVAISGDRLFVADIQHHQVQVLDKRTGNLLYKIGKAGSAVGELFHPTNLAIGPEGDVYVVETSNFRVQRFTQEGKSVQVYGGVGDTLGAFSRPKGIAIDREGRLYVGDAAFENVQIFSNDGKLLLFFGQPGDKSEGLSLPAGVRIDYDNVERFRKFADPRFQVEYVILVASQFGPNKVDVFGFGKMTGADYSQEDEGSVSKSTARIHR